MYEKLFNLAPVQLPAVRLSIGIVLAQGLRKIVVAVERLPCAEENIVVFFVIQHRVDGIDAGMQIGDGGRPLFR